MCSGNTVTFHGQHDKGSISDGQSTGDSGNENSSYSGSESTITVNGETGSQTSGNKESTACSSSSSG